MSSAPLQPIAPLPEVQAPANAEHSPLPPFSTPSLLTSMPPPSVKVISATPPPITYTLKQLLAHKPHVPSTPAGVSAGVLAAKLTRPTHSSSAGRQDYEWIHEHSLRPVMNLAITTFRERLDSMNCIRFDQPMALPWNASPMLSEGCVSAYLDAQILGAAWQAVLQMVPEQRNYDLQMAKQIPVVEGIPDQTYSVLRGDKCEALAIVELKSAGVVKGMLSVIDTVVQGVKMDLTDDWKAVTRQLRMYAASSNIHDVIVMDECVGLYFRFPRDPYQANDQHDFLYASTELGPVFGANPRLSLRELVVYAIISALDRKNIELRDFAANPSPPTAGPNARPYRNVLPGVGPPPDSKKRAASSATQTRWQSGKRGKKNGSGQHDAFDTFVLQLELITGKTQVRITPARARASSRDSGFCDGTDRTPPEMNTVPMVQAPLTALGAPFTTLNVERILKKNVAVVTDGASHFIAKLFPPHSDTDPQKWINAELAVYAECANLQGTYIPYLHGIYRFVDSPHNSSLVMLTEFIGSGATVEDVIADTSEIEDETDHAELARATGRLAKLQESAVAALESLHRLKVAHADVAGRNMLVSADDQVVLVDFGYSLLLAGDLARFRARRDDDLARMKKAFVLHG